MNFGRIPANEAAGAILAHSLKLPGRRLKKGRRLDGGDVQAMLDAGCTEVIVASLAEQDVHEDAAASRLAHAATGAGLRVGAPFTGRCNLFAEYPGLLRIDAQRMDAANLVHESLTLATLQPWSLVSARQMVATAKIIPFAAPGDAVSKVEGILQAGTEPALRVAPLVAHDVGLVQTRLGGTPEQMLDKTRAVVEQRLAVLGSRLLAERRCEHEESAVAEAMAELVADGAGLLLVAGASAIVDRRDVVPAGIERAGGLVRHFGMPVDPGNMLLLAHLQQRPVLGLPGCARSPKFNGFDQVLQRLLAGVPVTSSDIMRMGVGGLLKEFAGRPAPRAGRPGHGEHDAPRAPRVSALLMAAGRSRRMPEANKLLVEIGGRPMVRHTLDVLLASSVDEIVVVTGFESDAVRAAIEDGLDGTARARVRLVHNQAHLAGLGTSLATGMRALDPQVDAALVCLGDMPHVDTEVVELLLAAFDPLEGRAICIPTHEDKRGNPVLWGREFFAAMRELVGDRGARALVAEFAERVCEVPVPRPGVLLDIDSAEALAAIGMPAQPAR